MTKTFNVSGACNPGRHYMVNLEPRLYEIKKMIDAGKYFTINRARQYGKTTMLRALADYLKEEYTVLSLDFQPVKKRLSEVLPGKYAGSCRLWRISRPE